MEPDEAFQSRSDRSAPTDSRVPFFIYFLLSASCRWKQTPCRTEAAAWKPERKVHAAAAGAAPAHPPAPSSIPGDEHPGDEHPRCPRGPGTGGEQPGLLTHTAAESPAAPAPSPRSCEAAGGLRRSNELPNLALLLHPGFKI